jgi:hypothetical protein
MQYVAKGKSILHFTFICSEEAKHFLYSWSENILLLSGIYNPCEFEPPHFSGYMITHKDTPQSAGLLWTSDQPVAETSTWQHTQNSQQTNIHAPGGIRTSNSSRRSSADTLLRPLGHLDRRSENISAIN